MSWIKVLAGSVLDAALGPVGQGAAGWLRSHFESGRSRVEDALAESLAEAGSALAGALRSDAPARLSAADRRVQACELTEALAAASVFEARPEEIERVAALLEEIAREVRGAEALGLLDLDGGPGPQERAADQALRAWILAKDPEHVALTPRFRGILLGPRSLLRMEAERVLEGRLGKDPELARVLGHRQRREASSEREAIRREIGELTEQVRAARTDLHGRVPLSPRLSFSLREGPERELLRRVRDLYRGLSGEEREAADLLEMLGRLSFAAGESEEALVCSAKAALVHRREARANAARSETQEDSRAEATAEWNAHLAALESREWGLALEHLMAAAHLRPQDFAPFDLSRYAVESVVGSGGFGTVFKARDLWREQTVAIKSLRAEEYGRHAHELLSEARVLDRLDHANVVGLQDCGISANGRWPFLKMPWFEAKTLREVMDEAGGELPIERALGLALQMALGLAHAHRSGVLHRDIKPENVLVGAGDRVKLIDFGLAHATERIRGEGTDRSLQGTAMVGTLRYAAPEQLGQLPGVEASARSDIYSFGKVFCEMLRGAPGYNRRLRELVGEELDEVLQDCVDEHPQDRPESLDRVLGALEAWEREAKRGALREIAGHLESASRTRQARELEREVPRASAGDLERGSGASETSRRPTEAPDVAPATARDAARRPRRRIPPISSEDTFLEPKPVTIRVRDLAEELAVRPERVRLAAREHGILAADDGAPLGPDDTGILRRAIGVTVAGKRRTRPPRIKGLTPLRRNDKGYLEYRLDKDPSVELILVPGGEFLMGDAGPKADRREGPPTRVNLDRFLIGKHPVTREQFARSGPGREVDLEAPRSAPWQLFSEGLPYSQHPIDGVSWAEAVRYCEWAGLSLPTEAMWEFAARGREARPYPWGEEEPQREHADWNWIQGRTVHVSSLDAIDHHPAGRGPFGTFEQAGWVWEWCRDGWRERLPGGSVQDPVWPGARRGRVLKGGGHASSAELLRACTRRPSEGRGAPQAREIGLRVAAGLPPARATR